MKIGVVDADLIGRKRHRFPNLCCMKISGYHKSLGDEVQLVLDCSDLSRFDKVYVAKVFTDTPDPIEGGLFTGTKIVKGGTGYFFDKAPALPDEIEHHMPDYHLYDGWADGKSGTAFYHNYSIGYLTRGCFRKCPFCVNQKYSRAFLASSLDEFLDTDRKKICLLDDNFLSHPDWKRLLHLLRATKKPFRFKQGMDERILDECRCEELFSCKYDGDYTFAFDDVRDYPLIERKLKLIRRFTSSNHIRFYVLCGFKGTDVKDIHDTFKRIELLFQYGAIPYIMRYQSPAGAPYRGSRWEGMYTALARWCNQVSFVKKKSFWEFCCFDNEVAHKNGAAGECKSLRTAKDFLNEYPEIANYYFNIKWKVWE